jgi:hypothetical protein
MVNEWIVLELLEAGMTYTLPGWALFVGFAISVNGPDGDTPAEMLPGADETIEEYTQ